MPTRFHALDPFPKRWPVGGPNRLLRPRLLIPLILLVLLFLAAGAASLHLTSHAQKATSIQYEEHYPIVVALEKIKHSASRLTGSVVMQLAGREAEGYAIFHQNAEILTENLNLLASLPESPERDVYLHRLRQQVNLLLSESERVITQSGQRSSAVGFSQLLSSRVMDIGETVDRLMNAQRAAMARHLNTLHQKGRRATLLWWLSSALGLGTLYLSHRYLQERVFTPVEKLTSSLRLVGQGELDQMVAVQSDDEIGQLSLAFNQMTSQLRATRQGTTEQMVRLHRTMETTLASFPNAFFVLGKDRTIELRNPAADKLAVQLFLDRQAKLPSVIYDYIDRVFLTRQNYLPSNLKDALNLNIDNEEKFFLPRVLLLLDERGDTFGVAVILEDVTHQRLLDDVKTNILSTVSHELKTPLTSVRMALHLLLEESVGPLNDPQLELLSTAKEDSERLLRTLNNLLDLTRLEGSGPQLNLAPRSVSEIIESVATLVRQGLEGEGLRLVIDIEKQLAVLEVDIEKLHHVFSNFITNALNHSPPGGTITLRARSVVDNQIRLSVIDQGPGIPKEHLDRIFEKFYRVPGQSTTGAGLGLSIAREIALLHHGSIGVKSESGHGSEFFLDLPARATNLPELKKRSL
jgi:two-component system, NtrC family, sensor histidine kinase KinB